MRMVMGFSSPSSMLTFSMDSADTEWMSTFPASKGMRARPCSMSRASATLTTPASMVRGLLDSWWLTMAWRTSEAMMVASSGPEQAGRQRRRISKASWTL